MSNPNLLSIWAKHERGEGSTNEELGHLIEQFESLQDGLELAEQITAACRKVSEQHAELRKQAEAAAARVREVHCRMPVKVNFYAQPTDFCKYCYVENLDEAEYPCPTIRALDGDSNE